MSYPGGKAGAGVYQSIINQMPPHELYVEPFLGGGAVMRRKRPARSSIGIDTDAAAITAFPRESVPGLRLDCFDGILWLCEANRRWAPGTLVYCDPPYLLEARASRKRIYRDELDRTDHERLLRVVKALPVMVMISGYASELYHRELRDWRLVTFSSMTRGGTIATEHLWCNFPAPAALHDYRYLGADYRERERIKRKTERWAANYAEIPVLERRAVLSRLLELLAPEAPASESRIVIRGERARLEPQLPGFAR